MALEILVIIGSGIQFVFYFYEIQLFFIHKNAYEYVFARYQPSGFNESNCNLTCHMLLFVSWLQLLHIHESLIGVNQSLDHGLSSIWPQAI